ncbi:hypothetical protein E4U42_003365 [Claviceps africana]|uniref:MoaB/Mog domain-containing protein n=1 Tax=Claviceps africana TaxID=83212 RepID=A0A8K0J774_9HYPO|nr:hypothetical protein E4U42_003365 [Claviceps africana]
MDEPLTAALLIVSTTAAEDPTADSSASVLRDVLTEDGGGRWKVVAENIVADDVLGIQKQVMQWTDGPGAPNLIVTTGGTGFAVTDGTPEAIMPLLHKQAPGLVHAMLSASLAVTPFAMMSRPAAGVRHRSLVVTLPGSPKGARENLQAIIKTLPHACAQASGANSRMLHAGGVGKLEADAGIGRSQDPGGSGHGHSQDDHHNHHHHHHGHAHGNLVRHTTASAEALSNDPSQGPSRRHRESPYPMLSVDSALALISKHTPSPEIHTRPVDERLINSVLAQDVTAQENVPAFRASIVDGYAVVVPPDGKLEGVFPVKSISHAAAADVPDHDQPSLKEGEVARITTGAPLPPGATAVIMVEDTVLKSTTDDGREEKEVEIQAQGVKHGDNVREIGSDMARGSLILGRGESISGVGGEIGLLAAGGVAAVQTYRKPIVGILSTGDELVPHAHDHDHDDDHDDARAPTPPQPLRTGQVRDTNRITLLSAVRQAGFEALDLGIARDKPGSLEEMLRRGLRDADVLVTTGGVSMGELDLLKPTVERSLGGTIHFGRVAMKPGKPTTFATVPVKDTRGRRAPRLLFALPGNPASALVTFHLFVLPSLHELSGIPRGGLPRVPVVLAHDLAMDPHRPEFHRAIVTVSADGVLTASSTGDQRSSRVGSLRAANALVCVPCGEGTLNKGSKADALLMSAVRAL